MTHWWTADEHHKHKNILHHCPDRGKVFKDIDKMTNAFTKKHNERVGTKDVVWHIGDFCWLRADHRAYYEGLLERLNGTHHLVLGNHDYCKPFFYEDIGFSSVHTTMPLTIDGIRYLLVHDPARYYSPNKDTIMLCGHVHLMFKTMPKERIINVGVDMWDFYPVSIDQIKETVNSEAWKDTAKGSSHLEGSRIPT